MHRGEEATQDEVGGCWPSLATGPEAQHCSACRARRKIAGSCTSEGLKCQCDCQEKQGFQVEVTRGSSWSKSGCSKTLPFATATHFPSSSHSPPPCFSQLSSLAKCHPNAPPAPCSSQDLVVLLGSPQQTGSRCSKAGTTHVCTHTRGFSFLTPSAELC